jgi:hypothetical protein
MQNANHQCGHDKFANTEPTQGKPNVGLNPDFLCDFMVSAEGLEPSTP